jgi:hypothetical protein
MFSLVHLVHDPGWARHWISLGQKALIPTQSYHQNSNQNNFNRIGAYTTWKIMSWEYSQSIPMLEIQKDSMKLALIQIRKDTMNKPNQLLPFLWVVEPKSPWEEHEVEKSYVDLYLALV